MILPNVRSRLGPADLRLVIVALARHDAAAAARHRRVLLEQGPDRLLDEPGLLEALLAVRSLVQPSPALFAYVAVRHALRAAGIDSAELTDYFAALLLGFGDHDSSARLGVHDDQTYNYLVDIVSDLAAGEETGERAFLLRAHLGNYSLWLAGLFPDRIAYQRARAGGPDLPYYDELGRQGYDLASRHRLADRFGLAGIYRAAAERFPALRTAFNRLSDRIFFPNVFTQDKVLRSLV
jgi:hypothetical protein